MMKTDRKDRQAKPETRVVPHVVDEKVYGGPICPNKACKSPRSEVSRTVQEDGKTIRYRRCAGCGMSYKTVEQ